MTSPAGLLFVENLNQLSMLHCLSGKLKDVKNFIIMATISVPGCFKVKNDSRNYSVLVGRKITLSSFWRALTYLECTFL